VTKGSPVVVLLVLHIEIIWDRTSEDYPNWLSIGTGDPTACCCMGGDTPSCGWSHAQRRSGWESGLKTAMHGRDAMHRLTVITDDLCNASPPTNSDNQQSPVVKINYPIENHSTIQLNLWLHLSSEVRTIPTNVVGFDLIHWMMTWAMLI